MVRCEVGVFFCSIWVPEAIDVDDMSAPCPPINSSHPLSKDLENRCANLKGKDRRFCDERGVRNHIKHRAEFEIFIQDSKALLEESREVQYHENENPKIVTKIVKNFRCGGRKNSVEGVIIDHLRAEPAVTAPIAKNRVGVEQKISLSLVGCKGRDDEGDQITDSRNRAVYLAVSPVAKKNKRINIKLDGKNKENSRIMSFEQNPAKNGAPHSAIFATKRGAAIEGISLVMFPINRKSWEWWWM